MIFGASIAAFTLFHVIISLVAILSGLIVLLTMIGNKYQAHLTSLFLATTVLTSVTGFMFPFKGVTPGIILGVLSMIVLVLAIAALYVGSLRGSWRGTYVISAGIALYFNFFVLVAQSFQKIPALTAIAPTQASPIFGITQAVVLVIFIFLIVRAFQKFRRV